MKYYLNVGPEAFLEPKKKKPLSVLLAGSDSPPHNKIEGVRNFPLSEGKEKPSQPKERDSGKKKVPTPGASEMRLVDPIHTALLLVKHSNLSSLRIYPKVREAYLYDDSQGYFVKLDKSELLLIMAGILALTKLIGLQKARYLREVLDELYTSTECSYRGTRDFDSHVKVFNNGVLNLETKEFGGWTPKFFVNHGLSFNYDPEASYGSN